MLRNTTYLGICMKSLKMQICLPEDKLQDLWSELDFWVNHKKCIKKELQSHIGKLSFTSKVVPCSHLLYAVSLTCTNLSNANITTFPLTKRQDKTSCGGLNFFQSGMAGLSFFREWTLANDLNFFTDSSGTMGFGIYYQGEWLAEPWSGHIIQSDYSIQWKELFPIFVAATIWGHQWSTKKIFSTQTTIQRLTHGTTVQ